MTSSRRTNTILVAIALIALFIATVPLFFEIYRTAAFNTIARDDYAPYLLGLTGRGGGLPDAPYVYRLFSVASALPFFYLLPTYAFSNLQNGNPTYLRATEALAMVSYLSIVLTALFIYAIARRRCHASAPSAIIVALVSFFLSSFTQVTGVDPIAILTISALIYWLDNAAVFVPLVLLSAGINEKIPIIFATVLMFRWIAVIREHRKFSLLRQLMAACLAVAVYFAVVFALRMPGNANQTNPSLFLSQLSASLTDTASLKGFVLNGLPILLLLILMFLARRAKTDHVFQVTDLSAFFVLLILAFIADAGYNVGRIVMYAFPFYLPPIACLLDEWLSLKTAAR